MKRRTALLAAAVAGAVATVAAGAAYSTTQAQQSFSLRLDGKHLRISSTAWRPGAVQIAAISVRGEQELTLLRFRGGYSYAEFLADGRKADGHGPAARSALARIMARTDFVGGVDVFPGGHATFTALVRPGVYYLAQLNDRPLFRVIHVGGRPTAGLAATPATIEEYDFGFRTSGGPLPASGTITIHNTGRQPHRLNLEPLKAGTTRAQVGAYIRKTGARPYAPPPPFARRGPELGTALVSPGETIHFAYSVPPGAYALVAWQQDTQTGRSQALEGMYAVATLR